MLVLPLVYAALPESVQGAAHRRHQLRRAGQLHTGVRATSGCWQGVLRVAHVLPDPGPDHAGARAGFRARRWTAALLRLSQLFRLGIFVPYAVPGVVATLMWGYLYGPDFGPFAQLSRS